MFLQTQGCLDTSAPLTVVQLLSCIWLWDLMDCSMPDFLSVSLARNSIIIPTKETGAITSILPSGVFHWPYFPFRKSKIKGWKWACLYPGLMLSLPKPPTHMLLFLWAPPGSFLQVSAHPLNTHTCTQLPSRTCHSPAMLDERVWRPHKEEGVQTTVYIHPQPCLGFLQVPVRCFSSPR